MFSPRQSVVEEQFYILSIITLDWSSFKEAKFISRHFQHLTSVFLMTIFKD